MRLSSLSLSRVLIALCKGLIILFTKRYNQDSKNDLVEWNKLCIFAIS